jgi:ElaB/YqjD/DUF883 family membrane-anchored ribosome-binding protein
VKRAAGAAFARSPAGRRRDAAGPEPCFSIELEDPIMELTRDLEDTARDVRRRVRPRLREAQRRVEDLNDAVTDYVRENPVKCLLGAVAVGVLIGKAASR